MASLVSTSLHPQRMSVESKTFRILTEMSGHIESQDCRIKVVFYWEKWIKKNKNNNIIHDGWYLSFFRGGLVGHCKVQAVLWGGTSPRADETKKNIWNKAYFNPCQQGLQEKYRELVMIFGEILNAIAAGWEKCIYYWLEALNVFDMKDYPWVRLL